MMPLRHKREYFVSIKILFWRSNRWSYVWKKSAGRYLETHVKYGHVSWIIFGDGCDGPNCMDMAVARPLHQEEQETCLSLSMDYGKANIGFLPVEYLRVIEYTHWVLRLAQLQAHNKIKW